MLAEAITALVCAWVFTALLAWARSIPRRRDGRLAVSTTLGSIFLLAWGGGPYLCAILGLSPGDPFGYAFVGLLAAAALSTLARPVESARPESGFEHKRLVRLPNHDYLVLVGCAIAGVLARYAA